ncbi:anion permease [Telmatospirillum sp.]|uniref:anion permease n=1 Tax=Telmatospirillum sp. TaxID=2079197 RepID=UPI00283C09F0|nr:anion permease [Telmatospirillum sp.]MDR3437084.1 anion permease [Telmatospirillum sp.]
MNRKMISGALPPIVVWIVLLAIPVPQNLSPAGWHYFAMFAAVIVGLILEPVPGSIIGLLGVSVAAACQLIGDKPSDSVKWALSGFSNSTVWLIFVAYMFGLGYEKTGLGRRLALTLVKYLGKKTIGLGYAVALSDCCLGPFMPSNTARSGGTIYPIIKNIPEIFGSYPGETARKMGAYLMWTGLATCAVTSSLFLTANAPNLLGLELVSKTFKISISWREWFLGILPLGALLFLAVPLLTYVLYPPEIKSSEGAGVWARQELDKMGAVTGKEILMMTLACVALVFWIFGGSRMDATMVAIAVLVVMILTGVITWNDLLGYRQAWNMLIWFGTLVALADGLKIVGFLNWFAAVTSGLMSGLPIIWVVVLMVAIYYLVHYMFASLTAHATALLPVFLAAVVALPDMPLKLMAMLLCYTSGISCLLTPYASGPSAIYYGSGYIDRKDFWRLGATFGGIFLALFLLLGIPYLNWYLS